MATTIASHCQLSTQQQRVRRSMCSRLVSNLLPMGGILVSSVCSM